MNQRTVIAGDTFSIVYKHKPEGTLADLPEGYEYVLGLRKVGGKEVKAFKLSKGEISHSEGPGVYRWTAEYEFSKSLSGEIVAEMLFYSADKTVVQHCNEPLGIKVLPSFMNEVIDADTGENE